MTNEHDTIEQRLEKLERQNRRMKLAGVGTLVIAGAFLLMGQASGPRTLSEVRARSFVLVDAQGKQRTTLEMYEDSPRLAFLDDANGKIRAALGTSSLGPELVLTDGNGKAVTTLAVPSGGPTLAMVAPNATQGVILAVSAHGPELKLSDAN